MTSNAALTGDCLIDIRRQIKNQTESGISFAKTRSKYHVEVTVCGRKQFVGQFKDKADAKKGWTSLIVMN